MNMARKSLLVALMATLASGIGATASAQFGGMPTMTPQKSGTADVGKKKRRLPNYVVVDKGGPNSFIDDSERQTARYRSINDALKQVAWGGVVVVMPGEYEENITLERSVSLQGYQGGDVIIRQQPVSAEASQRNNACLTFMPNSFNEHAQISNIDFKPLAGSTSPCIDVKGGIFTMVESSVDGRGDHAGALVSISGGMAYLEKNKITGGRVGIDVSQNQPLWDRVSLVDNIVTRNYHQGVNLSGSAKMLATGNLVNDNGGVGINYNGNGPATLVGNKILNNGNHGMVFGADSREVLVRLNQIWSNDGDGINVENATGLIEDNDIDGNAGFEVSTVGHLDNVPTIVNDVRQNVSSPAYNRKNNRKADQTTWRVGNGPTVDRGRN